MKDYIIGFCGGFLIFLLFEIPALDHRVSVLEHAIDAAISSTVRE